MRIWTCDNKIVGKLCLQPAATRAADALGMNNLLARIGIDSVVKTNTVCETLALLRSSHLSLQFSALGFNKCSAFVCPFVCGHPNRFVHAKEKARR